MRYLIFIFIVIFLSVSQIACSEETHMHHHHGETMPAKKLKLSGTVKDNVRVIGVKAFRYGFDPDPIVVKRGENIRLEITSADVAHGLDIGIGETMISVIAPVGKTNSVDFVVNETGEYHIHCSVYCGPGHSDMHGTLIVIER